MGSFIDEYVAAVSAPPSLGAPPRARSASTFPPLPAHPDQRGQRGMPGPGEGAALLARAVDRDPGGVRVDGQPVPLGRGPGRPGPAQHDPVGATALATRPRSAPARNPKGADTLGSAVVARSANNARSDRKSPPASKVSTSARYHRPPV